LVGAEIKQRVRMASGSIDVESHFRTIFRRCVQCPPEPPSCPPCSYDETCSLKAESCSACASTACVKIGSLPGQTTPQHSTPVGAIVGGVVGGVALIVTVTFMVWFCKRNRKKQWDKQSLNDKVVEKRDQSTLHPTDRQSTRSMGSIASTVLTRASNVIQIAYIPGVTNRTPPDSPALHVPPVPALPPGVVSGSATSSPHFEQDRHFFMPGDLRDSTYSDMTEDQRYSLTPSLARASVATTLYRNDAVVAPMPAQQAMRSRPAMVSVKSGSSTPASQRTFTPPVPQVPKNLASSNSSIVARNLVARPIEVKKTSSGTNVPTLAKLARASSLTKGNDERGMNTTPKDLYDEKEVVLSPITFIEDGSPTIPTLHEKPSFASFNTTSSSSISAILPVRGPLRNASPGALNHLQTDNGGLNAMIEDAMNRAARDLTHTGLGSRPELRKHDSGPFSDTNEFKENIR